MKLHRSLIRLGFVAVTLSLFLLPLPSGATTVTFDLDTSYSGSVPDGRAPWLSATFDDGGTPGTVTLTMSAVGLTSPNYVDGITANNADFGGWFFNFNPVKDISGLSWAFVSGKEADNVAAGQNLFQADGGGHYDIRFQWDNVTTPTNTRFRPGNTAVYTFSDPGLDLIATDFYFLSSSPNIANGTYYSAARVQGIDADTNNGYIGADDGSVAVPEPGTALLLGFGLVGIGMKCRRKYKK